MDVSTELCGEIIFYLMGNLSLNLSGAYPQG